MNIYINIAIFCSKAWQRPNEKCRKHILSIQNTAQATNFEPHEITTKYCYKMISKLYVLYM